MKQYHKVNKARLHDYIIALDITKDEILNATSLKERQWYDLMSHKSDRVSKKLFKKLTDFFVFDESGIVRGHYTSAVPTSTLIKKRAKSNLKAVRKVKLVKLFLFNLLYILCAIGLIVFVLEDLLEWING